MSRSCRPAASSREDSVERVLRFAGGVLVPVGDAGEAAAAGVATDEPLLVADSWLVDEGRERAAGPHWGRFGAHCMRLGVPPEELRGFRAAASAALPREGRWFPRVELTTDGLALRIRPAPPLEREARVVVGPPGDPRTHPRRKGPDLGLLAGLRAQARARGADEWLLRDADGALLEGALSSLLWWEDDALCATPDNVVLTGVTRARLISIARRRGVEVRVRSPQPAELAGRETWLTSALHGIRVVVAWIDPAQEAGAATRAAEWREALELRG